MARDRIFIDNEKIIDTAYDLISEVGYWKFSTRKLAEALNVSPMTLYNYVENKDEIILRVFLKGMRNLFDRMQERSQHMWHVIERDPYYLYKILSEVFLDFAKHNSHMYTLLFNIPGIDVKNNQEIVRLYSAAYDMIHHLIPESKRDQARKEILMFLVLMNGLVNRCLRNVPGFTEELYHSLIDEAMAKLFSPLD